MEDRGFLFWAQDSLIRNGFCYIPKSRAITFNTDFLKEDPQEFDTKVRRYLDYGQLNEVHTMLSNIFGPEISKIFKQDPHTRFKFLAMRWGPENKRHDRNEWLSKYPSPPAIPEEAK